MTEGVKCELTLLQTSHLSYLQPNIYFGPLTSSPPILVLWGLLLTLQVTQKPPVLAEVLRLADCSSLAKIRIIICLSSCVDFSVACLAFGPFGATAKLVIKFTNRLTPIKLWTNLVSTCINSRWDLFLISSRQRLKLMNTNSPSWSVPTHLRHWLCSC